MAAPTIVLSEEESHRQEQAQMPDGVLIELKVPKLSAPSQELSEKGLQEYASEQAINGAMITPMAGSAGRTLYSLREVEFFLKSADSMDFMNAQQDAIGYVDFKLLARWVEEVITDTELADAVRDLLSQEDTYGKVLPFVKSLLQERIAAYRQCVAGAEAVDEAIQQ